VTSALEEGEWSESRPGRFTPAKDLLRVVQEAGWAPGPVWTSAKNLAPTGVQSPGRPAHSQSLYRLSYRAQNALYVIINSLTLQGWTYFVSSQKQLIFRPDKKWRCFILQLLSLLLKCTCYTHTHTHTLFTSFVPSLCCRHQYKFLHLAIFATQI
jgi:hypothetical protein